MKPNEKLGLVTCPVLRGYVSLSMQLGHNCVLRTRVLTQADILFHTQVSPHTYFCNFITTEAWSSRSEEGKCLKRSTDGCGVTDPARERDIQRLLAFCRSCRKAGGNRDMLPSPHPQNTKYERTFLMLYQAAAAQGNSQSHFKHRL